eukprot:CAMPEP_0117696102 /NCGR_PEP_ID=MMETSP0804-20121206/28501_1 /TAXON_ID=1074897 /ORGANISM="Tetraselmis astigmatica, Strain CCMP880" /LENGTH=489 /DNA_ID=CAMNT_0005510233 /DNA_START=8 /DNA_END=1479 /DNA_ORIENTATION=+
MKVPMLPVGIPYVLHGFGTLDLCSSLLILVLFVVTWWSDALCWTMAVGLPVHFPNASKIWWWGSIAGLTTMMLTLHFAVVFKFSRRLSTVFYAIQAVMGDVFGILIALWVIGFGCLLYWPMVGHHAEDGVPVTETMAKLASEEGLTDGRSQQTVTYLLLLTSMGMYDPNIFTDNQPWFVRVALLACMVMSLLVLVNLLVSSMVSKYENLHENYYELAIKSRAFECLQAEDSTRLPRRKELFRGLSLDRPCGFDSDTRGPVGGIQVMVPLEELKHPAYSVLDRVERYTGPAGPGIPWHDEDLMPRADGEDEGSELTKQLARMEDKISCLQAACEDSREQLSSFIESMTRSDAGGESEAGSEAQRVVSAEELAAHTSKDDITEFMAIHPGGSNLLLRKSGQDATQLFLAAHPDLARARSCLARQVKVGVFKPEPPSAQPAAVSGCQARPSPPSPVAPSCCNGPGTLRLPGERGASICPAAAEGLRLPVGNL